MTEESMTKDVTEDASIGERLREARRYLGLTQEFVAEELSIPRPAVGQIERGARRVSGTELKRLAVLYGRPIDWFVGGTEETLGAGEQSAALFRATSGLKGADLEEVVRFAEFLRSRPDSPAER